MGRKTNGQPVPVVIVQQVKKHEWAFRFPRITEKLRHRLHKGIESVETNPRRAVSILRKLITEYHEHLDACCHLAWALERAGRTSEAFHVRESAVTMALDFFPPDFSMGRDRLQWGFVGNQPFLRLYFAFGRQLMKQGATDDASQVFEDLLNLDPHDNQGVRGLAIACYFALNSPDMALSWCEEFADDPSGDVLYGQALALFQMGKFKHSRRVLDTALRSFPLVATELLKTKHGKPTGFEARRPAPGSPEEAYLYWEQQGKFWRETPCAIDFLRSRLPKVLIDDKIPTAPGQKQPLRKRPPNRRF